MAKEAADRYNIDFEASYMIGDTTIDIEFARRLGMKSVLVRTGEGGLDGKFKVEPDLDAGNVLEAVKMILGK